MDSPAFNMSRAVRQSEEGALPMSVATFYCGVPAAEKAAGLVERLMNRFSREFDIENSLWSFDVLRLNAVAEFAISCAARADVLVVATMSGEPLPSHVVRCLETAMSRRERRSRAVVALIENAPKATADQVGSLLRRLCCTNEGDSFFCATDTKSTKRELTPDQVNARANASSRVLDSIMNQPMRRDPYWGR